MNTSIEILRNIQQVVRKGGKVELINDYMGVPISYDAVLLGFGSDNLAFQVHEYQLVCMEVSRQVLLQVGSLPPIAAMVVLTDPKTRQVILNDFMYTTAMEAKRSAVRVQPKDPIPMRLSPSGGAYWSRGQVADISMNGIGVMAFIMKNGMQEFSRHTQVMAVLNLPNENGILGKELYLRGEIANIFPLQSLAEYRIGIRTFPDENTRSAISRYSAQRQAEIIRELKMLHNLMSRIKQPAA